MEERKKKHSAFRPEKMHTYLRGYASGLGMKDTLKALAFACEKHRDQFRKSDEPYIVHPLTMACNAVSMGIKEDSAIAPFSSMMCVRIAVSMWVNCLPVILSSMLWT